MLLNKMRKETQDKSDDVFIFCTVQLELIRKIPFHLKKIESRSLVIWENKILIGKTRTWWLILFC
jgi:hypothetical protein